MILRRGIELLAPGGMLAYSTCALCPVECEAVVASVLARAAGSVETVSIDVPGLRLAAGVASWSVPASGTVAPASASVPPGGITYSSWADVPEEERTNGRIRRSMFPPIAYTADAATADALSEQLRRCARLLPAHDDGGCFFLTLFRRTDVAKTALRRGERVLLREAGTEAVVRGYGSGRFTGRVRIAYPDGSQFHVLPEELEHLTEDAPTAKPFAKPGSGAGPRLITQLVPDEAWAPIAEFYGLLDTDAEAEAAGVRPFPREAAVEALRPQRGGDAARPFLSVACASSGVRSIGTVQWPQAAGRAVFFRAPPPEGAGESATPAGRGQQWPLDAFPWRPSVEAAALLAPCCTRRLLRMKILDVVKLLDSFEVSLAEIGGDVATWSPGSVIVSADPRAPGMPEVLVA